MAEVDAQAYAVTSLNAAAVASNSVETQQPGGSGALRQTMVLGDPTTRANMAAVGANGQLYQQGYQPAPATSSAVTTVSTVLSTSATGYNVATVTLRTFTGTSPSITFGLQASDDNTNWVTLQGINNTTGVVGTSFTQASALTAGTAGPSVDFTIGAYTNVRINVTAISGTSPSAVFGLGLQAMAYEGSPGIASLPSLPTGANSIGTVQPGNTQNTTNWLVAHGVDANAKTGTSYWNAAQLATVTAVKASAGKLYDLYIYNPNSTIAWLQMFDLATGSVTLGTTTPKKSFPIPALGYLDKQFTVPIGFATAISHAATTTATGLTAPTTGLVINGEYI